MTASIENATVLLVEDHIDLASTTGAFLEDQGFTMDYATDGQVALNLITDQPYDAIVLDLTLPNVDGLDVCRRLRDGGVGTPVLMLTARDQLDDKLDGFDAGADDYMVKPFEMEELSARLLAMIRRNRGEISDGTMVVHDLEFDTKGMRVERDGKRLSLSPTCLRILKVLMRESPKLVAREALEQELWGDLVPDSDTLRSHLYNLRKVIDRPYEVKLLHTIQGVGFKLAHPDEA